jgi:hypothetical protein
MGAKADPGWETFEPTDVGSPNGDDRPSSAGAGGEPNTPVGEAGVFSLRTRSEGLWPSTATLSSMSSVRLCRLTL